MAITRRLRCPNPFSHEDVVFKDGKKSVVTRRICGNILKIFDPEATFHEVFICSRCGAHMKFERNAGGLTTAYVFDKKMRIRGEDETVVVLGEYQRKRKSNGKKG